MSHKRFALLLTLLFLCIAGVGMFNHEMWRDEFEIFMELRDTPSFLALFPGIQPLPNLYLTLLYPLIKLWPYPATFQIFHLLIITTAVFVFNRYSPFTKLQKVLFTFSYFILFEYGIISRDYSMLVLLMFLLVIAVTRQKQHSILTAGLLFLLANHHLYGLFVSISILIYEAFHLLPHLKEFSRKEKKYLVISGVLLTAASGYLFSQYYFLSKFNRFFGGEPAPPLMTLRSIWNAFFPVPGVVGLHFWNTNIIPFPISFAENTVTSGFVSVGNGVAVAVSLLIVLGSIVIFSRKTSVLAAYLVNSFLQLAFLQYLSVFYIRYQGPLFLTFMYSYWLLQQPDQDPAETATSGFSRFFAKPLFLSVRKAASPFVTSVLCIQFAVGLFCYGQDARYPFTASYEAAEYIAEQKPENLVMVGQTDYIAQPISGYLNKKIYYPQKGDFGTYVIWRDNNRKNWASVDEILLSALGLHQSSGKNLLLVMHTPLLDAYNHPLADRQIFAGTRISFLKKSTEGIVPDEQYYLYLIYGGAENELP